MSTAPGTFRRTQIYLTAEEQEALATLARQSGRTRSELIREAIDTLVRDSAGASRKEMLAAGRGLWAGRKDLPDFPAIRREWDRSRTGKG
jgi:hypothetical protein